MSCQAVHLKKRGSFNKEGGISSSMDSVWDLTVFLEAGVEPSGARIVWRLGVWVSRSERRTLKELVL
jgi:hypothetical protein